MKTDDIHKMSPAQLRRVLREARRQLGPYTALQRDDAWRHGDAAIGRVLVTVIEILDVVIAQCPRGGAP